MKNSYPTEPVKTDSRDFICLNTVTLGMIKQLVDQNGVQADITIKTDGMRITLTKKYQDKTVRKRTVDIDNGEYGMIQAKFMGALQELQFMGI